jgi:ADP-dependent NAD(P)H-hydrate dehydratase / NAD(P)H-hydrate epimerase
MADTDLQRLLAPSGQPIAVLRQAGIRAQEAAQQALSIQPLMALAGLSAAQLARAVAPHARRIWIAAGPGNNGGDGLQAARHLHRWGIQVQVSLMGQPEQLPTDAHAAWVVATAEGVCIHPAPDDDWLAQMTAQDLCIDALLGIGANRAPSEAMQSWIERLNRSAPPVLALDTPSGLNADSGQTWASEPGMRNVVHAAFTLTYLAAKPGLFMGHGRDLAGDIWLDTLSAACPSEFPRPQASAWLNRPETIAHRAHASHKGSHGDVAIVGGEAMQVHGMGMSGAAVLAAQAALHAGAGRVILSLLGQNTESSAAAPDVMQRSWDQLDLNRLTVVAGCGGGQAIRARMAEILKSSARLVLDADGLNALALDAHLKALLRARADSAAPQATVMTPHPLEAARLLGCTAQVVQQDRLLAAQTLSDQLQCTVVLKGSGTVIASHGELPRINTSGNGLLAIGGTGDVLAGLTGALLAQGWTAHGAACQAVWRHGAAADQWPQHEALTASRLAARLR